jgi:hypothetical protein
MARHNHIIVTDACTKCVCYITVHIELVSILRLFNDDVTNTMLFNV